MNEYHRSVELSLMRRHMAYGRKEYSEDWESVIAIAQIMAVDGQTEHMERIMEGCFKRIQAFRANTGLLPWEGK